MNWVRYLTSLLTQYSWSWQNQRQIHSLDDLIMEKGAATQVVTSPPVAQTDRLSRLTSGRALVRNTVWNLLGQGVPMVVAVFAIPVLIKVLGTERFGILTIAWMVIGYFSLFDLGLGRSLTHLVAEKLGAGQHTELPSLVWTSLLLMLALGLLGMLVMILLSPWMVYHALKIPEALQLETLQVFYLLAMALPVVISTVGLRGLLEAQQRFDLTNVIRIAMGVFTFAGPMLVLPFAQDLWSMVAILVAGRTVALIAHGILCLRVMPVLLGKRELDHRAIRPLLRFGSWMTVSNIVSPLMVYLDRLLIGALLSVTAVAYYATPFEAVTKLLSIPGALAGVLFPAFSAAFTQDTRRTTSLYYCGIRYTLLLLLPVTLIIVVFAKPMLRLWLGAAFAEESFRVMQILIVGVLINGIAHIPFAFVQSARRPDLTAKLHLLELPFYLASAFLLINRYGIEGAAVSWLVRVTIDACLLWYIARRLLAGETISLTYNGL